jgi:6-phosphogluconolactonase (cycloisomerase 2 family)
MFKKITFKIGVCRLLIAALVLFPLLIGTVGTVAASNVAGSVYTMTNSSAGNKIQEFDRAGDGKLTMGGSFSTGGKGSGAGLGSQGAIVLSKDNHWLFAVNAGSNEISVFSVQANKLKLVDKASSHGSDPISLTVSGPWLYVLNAGGGIAGFRVTGNGHLSFIQGSVRPLSSNGGSLSPEEIGFTPDGGHLVVSEKGSNLIDTYAVENGVAHGPVVNKSAGPAPYGFGFTPHGALVISEAANSAASTYKVGDKGLKTISASVLDTQAAACWLVVSADGSLAYAANAGSGTLSAYGVSDSGKLSLLSAVAGDTGAGSHPIDMDFSSHDQFLYALSSGNSMINAFAVNDNGSLDFIGSFSSPAGASGLAAR